MSGSSTSGPSGTGGRGVVGAGLDRARELLEQLRTPGVPPAGARPDRSDVRDAVLVVLADAPADGYGVARALRDRVGGGAPGPGEVYPALQLFADDGLVRGEATDGRRWWHLTAAGRAAAEAARERTPARAAAEPPRAEERSGVARAAARLAGTAAIAARTGTPDQAAEVAAVLDDARRRIFAILGRG